MNSLTVPDIMSTSSDLQLVGDELDTSQISVFLPSTSTSAEHIKCQCAIDIEDVRCDCMVDVEQPSVHRLKRDHSQRHSQRSHRHSRNNSTNSRRSRQGSQRRQGSQKRHGSQKHHRQPSRHGSTKDKKRLLSEQKSDSSDVGTASSDKPRLAVQIIITVAVLLTLMSIIIVAATLLMSGKMEEMGE